MSIIASIAQPPVLCVVVALDQVPGDAERDDNHPPPRHHEIARRDDDAGRHRQLRAETREERGEGRDDLPQDGGDDEHGNDDDGDRVDHRRLHLALQLDVLLDVDGEALENRVEDAARLAGGDHVGVERVERLRVALHAVGERRAALDVLAHLEDDRGKVLVRLLLAEDLEALHERQPGVDHDGELPGEDRQILGRHALAGLGCARRGFGLGLRLGGALAGSIRVTMICSRRSADTAASIVSAMRSPVTVCPVRVRPEYANVGISPQLFCLQLPGSGTQGSGKSLRPLYSKLLPEP